MLQHKFVTPLGPQAGLFHSYSQQPFAYLEDLTTFHLGLLSFKQTIPSAFFCKSSRALPPSFLLFPPDSACLICMFSEVSCPKLGPVGLSEVLPAKYIMYLIYIIISKRKCMRSSGSQFEATYFTCCPSAISRKMFFQLLFAPKPPLYSQ